MPPKLVEKYSPINLRSNSSTSGKSTINDVLLAIELMHKAQDELKAENKLLLDALRHGLDSLTSRFDTLSATLSALSTKVTSLDARVLALESTSPSTQSPLSVSDVISEFAERDRCRSNVLAHGLPESSASNFAAKIAEDKSSLSTLFSQLSLGAPVDFKVIRLGKLSSNKPRPVKIIFCNQHTAANVLSTFRTLKKRSPDFQVGINLVRDKTRLEREQLRVCHQELARRNQEGEPNLTITYQNGVPCIQSSRLKNRSPTIVIPST